MDQVLQNVILNSHLKIAQKVSVFYGKSVPEYNAGKEEKQVQESQKWIWCLKERQKSVIIKTTLSTFNLKCENRLDEQM